MIEKIKSFVTGTHEYLQKIKYDTSIVGSIWVLLSLEDSERAKPCCVHTVLEDKEKKNWEKLPQFQPTTIIPDNIDYFYKVYLHKRGFAKIESYKTKWSETSQRLRRYRILTGGWKYEFSRYNNHSITILINYRKS